MIRFLFHFRSLFVLHSSHWLRLPKLRSQSQSISPISRVKKIFIWLLKMTIVHQWTSKAMWWKPKPPDSTSTRCEEAENSTTSKFILRFPNPFFFHSQFAKFRVLMKNIHLSTVSKLKMVSMLLKLENLRIQKHSLSADHTHIPVGICF